DPYRAGARGHRGLRAQLRGRHHVPAAGASDPPQAPGPLLSPPAAPRDARSLDIPHARARLSVPHHGPDPRRRVGAHRVGQRLCVRPAGLLLAGGLADLCRHPGRSRRGRLARTPRGVLRHRRLRGARGDARRRALSARTARRLMPLFAAGISHKNAPLALREQLAADEGKVREILRDLVGGGVLREAVILSTCNRVEVYGVADVPGEARAVAFRHLCRQRGVEVTAVEEVLYTHAEDDATRHAFRVASSLDSMMIGEPQILGQVKDAFALAQGCEAVGPALHTLFTQAFAVAKRVRTETEIARHAVSISFAAVELAKKIFARLAGRAVLLVGAGKMSELAAKHLVEHGAFPIYVVNRTWARAQEMARALSGTAVPFEELETALAAVWPETRAAIEALSAGIVNKILHAPITKLRESSRAGAHRSWLAVVHELFGLGRRS